MISEKSWKLVSYTFRIAYPLRYFPLKWNSETQTLSYVKSPAWYIVSRINLLIRMCLSIAFMYKLFTVRTFDMNLFRYAMNLTILLVSLGGQLHMIFYYKEFAGIINSTVCFYRKKGICFKAKSLYCFTSLIIKFLHLLFRIPAWAPQIEGRFGGLFNTDQYGVPSTRHWCRIFHNLFSSRELSVSIWSSISTSCFHTGTVYCESTLLSGFIIHRRLRLQLINIH